MNIDKGVKTAWLIIIAMWAVLTSIFLYTLGKNFNQVIEYKYVTPEVEARNEQEPKPTPTIYPTQKPTGTPTPTSQPIKQPAVTGGGAKRESRGTSAGIPVETHTGLGVVSWYSQIPLIESYKALAGDSFGAASSIVEHGTRYSVCSKDGSKCVVVTVNDYCAGCSSLGRRFDLSDGAFAELESLSMGLTEVIYKKL